MLSSMYQLSTRSAAAFCMLHVARLGREILWECLLEPLPGVLILSHIQTILADYVVRYGCNQS